MRGILATAASLTLAGCDVVDWPETMRSQVAMPNCTGAEIVRTRNEPMGQDYINDIEVRANATCMKRWQAALQASPEYDCKGLPLACTRYDENRRYDEEWATVTFLSSETATVRLSKI